MSGRYGEDSYMGSLHFCLQVSSEQELTVIVVISIVRVTFLWFTGSKVPTHLFTTTLRRVGAFVY